MRLFPSWWLSGDDLNSDLGDSMVMLDNYECSQHLMPASLFGVYLSFDNLLLPIEALAPS